MNIGSVQADHSTLHCPPLSLQVFVAKLIARSSLEAD